MSQQPDLARAANLAAGRRRALAPIAEAETMKAKAAGATQQPTEATKPTPGQSSDTELAIVSGDKGAPGLKKKAANPSDDQLLTIISKGPSLKKAERYRNLTCPRKKVEEGYETYSVCGDEVATHKLSKYGVGTMQYFNFVRSAVILFLFMSILSVPLIGVDYWSSVHALSCLLPTVSVSGNVTSALTSANCTYYPAVFSYAAPFSLAGVGANPTISFTIPVLNSSFSFTKGAFGMGYSMLDALICICFILFIKLVAYFQRDQAEVIEQEQLSEADFTVKVEGLPADCADREELKAFFEGFAGSVSDVVIAFNDGPLLDLFNERVKLKARQAAAEKRGDLQTATELVQAIGKHDDRVRSIRSSIEIEPICAYVTFEWRSTAGSLLRKYPSRWWQRLCCAAEMYKFRGKTVFRISRAPEANNVLYTNMSTGVISRFLRRMATFFVCVILCALTAGATWFSQTYQSKLVQVNRDCPAGVTAAMSLTSSTMLGCFCTQNPSDSSCSTYTSNAFMAMVTLYGCGLVASIANTLIGWAVQKLGPFEKHSSVSNEQSAMLVKMVIAKVINTAFIPMIVRGNFSAFGGSIPLLNGQYTEFTTDWFDVVGEQIAASMIFNMFIPHLPVCCCLPCGACARAFCRPCQKTQDSLNRVYAGDEFLLAQRYAAVLNSIFVAMIFYSGMPYLIILATISIFLTFWSERFILFYASRMPHRLDRSVSEAAMSMLPAAAFLHCLIGGWIMTAPSLSSPTPLADFVTTMGDSVSSGYSSTYSLLGNAAVGSIAFITRALNLNAVWQLIIAVLIVLYYLLYYLYDIFVFCEFRLGGSGESCRCCRSARVRPGDVHSDCTFREAERRFPMHSYRVSEQREFKDAYLKALAQMQSETPSDGAEKTNAWVMETDQPIDSRPEYQDPANPPPIIGANVTMLGVASYYVPLTREEQIEEIRKRLSPEQKEILERQLENEALHAGDLLEISCPTCFAQMEVYDMGDEDMYICTSCGGQFIA